MSERKYFMGRADGFLYGYLNERDNAAGFLGDNGTPIAMTAAVAEKLFGDTIGAYTLIPAKDEEMDIREKTKKLYGYSDSEAFADDYVKEYFNCREAVIDETGDIWIDNPQSGHWCSDDELEGFIKWCEHSFGWTFE